MNIQPKLSAFTLVELIVVITIIGILSTVWFVSYSNYLTWARDSNRYSQLTKLSDSLQVYATSKSLPLPDDYIEITASWASNVIAYQGYVGTDVLETIDYTNGGKDPKDDSFYTYYLTKDRKSLQLMALMEEAWSVALNNTVSNTTFAADYSDRFPKVYWRKLWVLTEVDTNTPVQELNILTTAWYLDIVNTNTEYNAHISNEEIITGTGSSLLTVNPESSCKRIKQTWVSRGDEVYTISPVWTDFQVYCDMETNWGWWTAATMLADTTTRNLFNTGNTEKIISITEDIFTKWTISDIWRDNQDKDLMLRCHLDREDELLDYEIPFFIYEFKKNDIENLEKSNRAWTNLSSSSLTAEWNNFTYKLSNLYYPSSDSDSLHLQTIDSKIVFAINWSFSIFATTWDIWEINSPAWLVTWNLYKGMNMNNYCVSFIR